VSSLTVVGSLHVLQLGIWTSACLVLQLFVIEGLFYIIFFRIWSQTTAQNNYWT